MYNNERCIIIIIIIIIIAHHCHNSITSAWADGCCGIKQGKS